MRDHKKEGLGKEGKYICPKCGETVPHQQGVPCQGTKCPECGAKMLRKSLEHYEQWIKSNIYD